jgi:hypothetical protein
MSTDAQSVPVEIDPHRNRLELIRFTSREARVQAFNVLIERGHGNVSANDPNVWSVRTDVVRALLGAGVEFEWLTREL